MPYDDELPDVVPEGGVVLRGTSLVLLQLLGKGGQGRAYRALDPELQREVVVKIVFAPDGRPSAGYQERMRREARLQSQIEHPAVTQLFSMQFLGNGNPCLVMEYVRGQTLSQRLRREGPVPLREALRIVSELCGGLGAAHALGIIHRDVKPSNLMLTPAGAVKVIDFGIAKKVSDEHAKEGSGNTTQGQIVGTPGYTSPELAYAQVPSPASDLYSVGCIFYEMLTGRPPFVGADLMEVLGHHIHTPPPALAAAGYTSPLLPELEGLVARLLAKDPKARPQSAIELAGLVGNLQRRLPADVQITTDDASSEAPTMAISFDAVTRQDARSVSHAPVSTVADGGPQGLTARQEAATRSAAPALMLGGAPEASAAAAAAAPEGPVVAVTAVRPAPARRGRVALAIGAVVALCAGGAGFLLARSSVPPGKEAPPSVTGAPEPVKQGGVTSASASPLPPSMPVGSPSAVPPTASVPPSASALPPTKKVASPPASGAPSKAAPTATATAATPAPTTAPPPTGKPAIDDRT